MKGICKFIALFLIIYQCNLFAGEVALTIDDLPFVGNSGGKTSRLNREAKRFMATLHVLREENVPAAGFVVSRSIEHKQWDLLQAFHQSGNIIANHTHTHKNLNRTSASRYKEDIAIADQKLKPMLSTPKYFRYPFLAKGRGKKQKEVRDYLHSLGYQIVPVTIDSKDFRFNQQFVNIHWRVREKYLDRFRRRYLGYIWRKTKKAEREAQNKVGRPIKQILLIHMNLINSLLLRDIIQMYRKNGYRFITVTEALKDPYYNDKK